MERFTVLFEKLAEAGEDYGAGDATGASYDDVSPGELDAIDELRRLALSLESPEPALYTTS